MQLGKERQTRRLVGEDDRDEPRPAGLLSRQTQGFVIFELLPRSDLPAGEEQHRIRAGDRIGNTRHPPGAADDVARGKVPLVARPARGECRLHPPRLPMIGRVIADKHQHAASPSLWFIVPRADRMRDEPGFLPRADEI
jgi:hypothetical protein